MKNKIIFCGLMVLILIICATSVCAEDSLENSNLTASNEEIDLAPIDSDEMSSSEITITEDNYDDYFNKYTGKLKDDVDKNINTIKIGNVSNKAFTIDRPLNLMPCSSDCQIVNGVIHLISGSSGSNITNLIINNTKDAVYQDGLFVCKLHGIWLTNSSDNLISNNTIRIPGCEGSYAMPMGYSSRNKILYNDIETTFTSCLLMGSCDYNNISYNRIEIKSYKDLVAADVIYFNCFGHADYSGPADSIGTYISNNYLKNNGNSIWEIPLNILGESNDTTIINNTVVGGSQGIKVFDEWAGIQAKNVLICNNRIINSTCSISSSNRDIIITNNTITGSSQSIGIFVISDSKYSNNVSVFNNFIEYGNLYYGIDASGANVFNNVIRISNYGAGIRVGGNRANITNNQIYASLDEGIVIVGNNGNVSNNVIYTKNNGIFSKYTTLEKYSLKNNTIVGNKIYSGGYAVYIYGYVYNTTINNNFIETNQSDIFFIDIFATLENNNPGEISENTINGVIKNTEILIINDTNFYDYFDEEGYLNYNFKSNSQKILFLTFLSNKNLYFTDSITLTSNKQPNLLYNITITLTGDASDSIIKDFKFYSFDKESIILDGVDNVVVKDNQFTTITNNIFESKTISIIGGCTFCNITDNNMFINSKADYTYSIYASNPSQFIIKRFSSNFTISNNNILIKSSGVSEAMYFDALIESNITSNNINIISDGSAYGIAICDVMGRPYNFILDSNKIIINSKEMSYLIELFKVDGSKIINNYFKVNSNGVYAVGMYNSSSVINQNEFIVEGGQLTDLPPSDALGKGNSVIYLTKQSQIKEFKNNIIYSQECDIITKVNSDIQTKFSNAFVISNDNFNLFFDSEGKLFKNYIEENDIILFKNFSDTKTMDIDVSVMIKPYYHYNDFKGNLILSDGSDGSKILGFNFNNANIRLNNNSDVSISFNNFTNSKIESNWGCNNNISNNLFKFNLNNSKCIIFNNCVNASFEFNNLSINSSNCDFILILKSNSTNLIYNSFKVFGNSINLIASNLSNLSNIAKNNIYINASGNIHVYNAGNAMNDDICNNSIIINSLSDLPLAIYYYDNSSQNSIKFNRIISNCPSGQDYAIVLDSQSNIVTNNYLISANGFRKGNDAVKSVIGNIVHDNLPVKIYVSTNGSENGNGSFENPYPTIKKAIENCLSGSIIFLLPGVYNESNIVVDKNVTLTAINLEGNTYINALNNQLFTIKPNGILTVNALKIFNGFCVDGGSLFNNQGLLIINNSVIFNSSSYYNNSNPIFSPQNKYTSTVANSYDCKNLGIGGAILNRGELIINSSTLYDNFAHKGGAIADFGKTTIVNSLICNNTGVHGGAIYTNSNKALSILNSVFKDNVAIQTLDYCPIQRIETNGNVRYHYSTRCEILTGMGGAIFSNTTINIDNSLFSHNVAKCGGAIAFDSNILTAQNYNRDELDYTFKGSKIVYSKNSILNIYNSIFNDNEAKNTSCGNLSMLADYYYGGKLYNIHFEGGAIFGALRQFNVYNTTFDHNVANSYGGALCVQSLNSSIEKSKFIENVAGGSGGALDVFGDFIIFNTEIINNSARTGGALHYSSYSAYKHAQNSMSMFNVSVIGNKALDYGGAFSLSIGNFYIKNSNIFDNTAPVEATMHGSYSAGTISEIDARGNWWGSTNGPDNSVWNQNNIRFKFWLGQTSDWKNVLVHVSDGNNNNPNPGDSSKPSTTNSISTGFGVHTGSTLSIDSSSNRGYNGFNFHGNWPNGNNRPSNNGNGSYDGVNQFSSSGNSKTNSNGNVANPNSLSKTNSSSVNNLDSIGMTSNAADSSLSSQSSSGEGSNIENGKTYEITKNVKKEIIENEDLSIFNVLFILLWIFLFIGFYRKYCEDNN